MGKRITESIVFNTICFSLVYCIFLKILNHSTNSIASKCVHLNLNYKETSQYLINIRRYPNIFQISILWEGINYWDVHCQKLLQYFNQRAKIVMLLQKKKSTHKIANERNEREQIIGILFKLHVRQRTSLILLISPQNFIFSVEYNEFLIILVE